MNRKTGDRFDLTLECIRRHYVQGGSPLSDVLERNHDFFELFDDFQGYVEFFFLQDLVSEDSKEVKFYLPFDNFEDDPLPQDLASYNAYLDGVVNFANRRAERIVNWCSRAL